MPDSMSLPLSVPPPARARPQQPPSAETWLVAALVVEIVAVTFEGPIRLLLNAGGADALIFLRDAFVFLALGRFLLLRAAGGNLPAAVLLFGILLACHAAVSLAQLRAPLAVLYGVKLAVPLLAGWLAPQALFAPGPTLRRLFVLLYLAAVGGAVVDALSPTDMPWVGVTTTLGGVDVELARDWQSAAIKRVGGLARYSNALAITVSLLTLILLGFMRSTRLRIAMLGCTLVVLVWTTQKGAILGFVFTVLALSLCGPSRTGPLRVAVVVTAVCAILAPVLLPAFPPPSGKGVFSLESFAERIRQMWPDAWHWIGQHSLLAGVGLGGIGGAQRFYAPLSFNAADNLFIFLYANCGLLAGIYLAATALACACAPLRDRRDRAAMTSVVFVFSYGIVLSMLEDQIAALWLGAAVGWLTSGRPPPALAGDGPR